ncbi:metal-dependent hydrolase [Halogeometricum sp. S1BR25-6]|uniref:Metal-dependent hydrolase n=1 Tax=Halogeometricum salsisoli TaxID=2950536 RepID=A0ABU2GC12_9EURY|nr:metal-dependent hydrolase [Halogeometricum sp. S1BR25-6]MDS0297996.1 metal-dependent hydrolase [Halogeometricum sp. S1BR25-6]
MNKDGHVLNGALLAVGLGVILAVDPTAGPLVEETPSALALTAATRVAELSLPIILGALFPDVDTALGRHRKTLHNLPVLALFVAFPYVFGNLQFVWVGVATHYVLDVVGSKRGIALFYPLSPTEYDLPTGVATSSRWATTVTVVVTAFELAALAVVHYYVFALDTPLSEAAVLLGL